MTKVLVRLERDEDDYPPADTETLWARRLDDGTCEIDNIPFFAKGVSYRDIISIVEKDGQAAFDTVVRHSGHSTIRVIIFDQNETDEVRRLFRDLGCSTELSHLPGLIAVDVPPREDLARVQALLQEGFDHSRWDFEEGNLRQ